MIPPPTPNKPAINPATAAAPANTIKRFNNSPELTDSIMNLFD